MSAGYKFRHRTRWQIALRYSGLPTATRAVAWALSTWWTSDANKATPSLDELAHAASLDRSSVARALITLEQRGWITRRRGGGRGNRTSYEAIIPELPEAAMERVLNRRTGATVSPDKQWLVPTLSGRKLLQGRTETVAGGNSFPRSNSDNAEHENHPAYKAYRAGLDELSGSTSPEQHRAPAPWVRHGMTARQFLDLSPEQQWDLYTPEEQEAVQALRAEKEAETA